MRKLFFFALFALLCGSSAFADVLSENFNSVASLTGSGWTLLNNSSPPGATDWFQGNTAVFAAQSGPADSYIAANFNNAAFGGNISNWLITPELDLSNAILLTFFTRTESAPFPGDTLEVRLSTNGSSTDVGSTDSSLGDFTTLLLSIGTATGYPTDWTQYTVTIPGISPGTQGRIAFRYQVTDTSISGDYIGLDSVTAVATPEPATLSLLLLGAAVIGSRAFSRKRAG